MIKLFNNKHNKNQDTYKINSIKKKYLYLVDNFYKKMKF